ncbi:MAG: peptidoglycan recognition protein family protein [Planctomycetota bacterium]
MLPRPDWPDIVNAPPKPTVIQPPKQSPRPGQGTSAVNPIPRSVWTSARPNLSNINPINGVNRITIHHEGSPALVNFTDQQSTANRLEQIRNYHRHSNGWADIGYHYIIDRAGRVWEGRSLRYQGAHVKNNNENNIGVMVLGNFNQQHASGPQLASLQRSVQDLSQKYRVSTGRIFTHREIGATSCPGNNLQPRIDQMRRRRGFG